MIVEIYGIKCMLLGVFFAWTFARWYFRRPKCYMITGFKPWVKFG